MNALTPAAATVMDAWLRRHTPMRDRVFRNTRQTMRAYQAAGILGPEVVIPVRRWREIDSLILDLVSTIGQKN